MYTAGSELHDLLYGPTGFRGGPLHYILVARVCLGHCIRTQDGATNLDGGSSLFAPGAGRKELAEIPGSGHHHHSLLAELGGCIVRYREFVTFHGEAYTKPEYLIAYSRTSS